MTPPPPNQNFVAPKRDFLGKPAPAGYVAGIGRGATGFTTRSDIGPAREAAFAARANDDGSGPSRLSQAPPTKRQEEDEEEDLNESNYDEFAGYGGSLFSRDPYEEDDEEADKIYEEIDKHIDERGKALREKRARQELEVYRQERPKIQQQFIDLKADLKQVSLDDWANIPDVGDARNRKQRVIRQDKFTPVPDSLLAYQAKLAAGGENLVYLDPEAMHLSDDEFESENDDDDNDERTRKRKRLTGEEDDDDDADSIAPKSKRPKVRSLKSAQGGQGLNIGEMSEFRSSYMSMKLSRVSSNSGDGGNQATVTNPHAYLTDLNSMPTDNITDTATVAQYRKQFENLRKNNPTLTDGWIASIRLEEAAGKMSDAKALVLKACETIPKSADLWLEAIRLHPQDYGRPLMVKAIQENPKSIKLWLAAAELERDVEAKRRVFKNARELLPKQVVIWMKSVELEPPEQARTLLRQAVECCPDSVELWLALARLLPYEEANQVLKEANEKNPKDRRVWITAAKLQEQVGKLDLVGKIIQLSVKDLAEKGAEIVRNEWLKEAVDADKAGFKRTCHEIIRRIIGWSIPEAAKLDTWLNDAESFIKSGSINCARAVYMTITEDKDFLQNEKVWLAYANFERDHDHTDQLIRMLRRSIEPEHCIKSEALWLLLAEQTRAIPDECRRVLEQAHNANPNSENIVMAAVELEMENGNSKVARRILADACMSTKSAQLVMRAAKLEWSLGNLDEAVRMLKVGVDEYKNHAEFYLSLGQIEKQRGDINKAKGWVSNGLKFNPTSVELWISMAHLEEGTGAPAKARSRLEMARIRNPHNVQLWLESAQLEWRQYEANKMRGTNRGRPDSVITMLAKGVKDCKGQPDVERLEKMQAEVQANK